MTRLSIIRRRVRYETIAAWLLIGLPTIAFIIGCIARLIYGASAN